MKTIFRRSLLLLAVILSVSSKAQNYIDLNYVTDSSSFMSYCSAPAVVTMNSWGYASGYNPATDSIDLHYYWNDGNDTIVTIPIIASSTDYFYDNSTQHIYNSPGIYTVMVTATALDGLADTMYNYPITISTGCSTVTGYCYNDNNSNCIFDAGDVAIAGAPVEITDASGALIGFAYSDTNGFYSMSILNGLTGLNITSPIGSWYLAYNTLTCPASGSYTFSSGASNFDFAFNCNSSSFDLYAYHAFSGVGAPGTNASLSFYIGNFSCASTPATITLTLDPEVSYIGTLSGPAPTSVAGNVLTWTTTMVPSLYWGSSFHVNLAIYTATSAIINNTACFNLSITPTSGDSDPSNNTHNWCLIIGGPYDPNSKEVSPAGIGAAGNVAPGTDFTYTVNFQNTGTAPAMNVYVMDTISSNLDMSTFHIIASSHSMNPIFYEGNIVRFDFPGIALPDSNASEPLSHGWVKYKVKAKSGLANGTQIKNTAHIFFDYNSAIVTNTTLNTISTPLGIEENNVNAIESSLYPNPATDNINVAFGRPVSGTLSLVDVTGRVVKSISLNNSEEVIINLDGLSSGVYGITMPGIKFNQSRVQVIR